MRWWVVYCAVLVFSAKALPKDRRPAPPLPNQFEIAGTHFSTSAPPADFYELFLVRPTSDGTSIERITLTPAADACTLPAKVETRAASSKETIAALLGTTNPCTIPEKELHRELRRCKKCLVFSGANVTMQVQCGSQIRTIRSDILDKDMFDPQANTPQHTSWTMRLLARLDQAIGPGVMERPIFPMPEAETSADTGGSKSLGEVSSGKYDALFEGAPDKPSDLYRAAQVRPASPTVKLISVSPLRPEVFVEPRYPPLAKVAHIQGLVVFKGNIDPDGHLANLTIESGHPMLRGVVENSAGTWRFPKEAANQEVRATIEFKTNCPTQH